MQKFQIKYVLNRYSVKWNRNELWFLNLNPDFMPFDIPEATSTEVVDMIWKVSQNLYNK